MDGDGEEDAGGSGAAEEDNWPPTGGARALVVEDDEPSLVRVALQDLEQQKMLAAQHAEARAERQVKHDERKAVLLALRKREALQRAEEGGDEDKEAAAAKRERALRLAASKRERDIIEQVRGAAMSHAVTSLTRAGGTAAP